MTNHATLDAAILKALAVGPLTRCGVMNHPAVVSAYPSAATSWAAHCLAHDRIPPRLQALRKAGRIEFTAGKWQLKEEQK